MTILVDRDSIAVEDERKVTFTLSEPSPDFDEDAIEVIGGTLSDLIAESSTTYTATLRISSAALEAVTIMVRQGRFSDGAMNANTVTASTQVQVDPRPPLQFAQTYQPLPYAPELRYSYYSPGVGTVNVEYTDLLPSALFGEFPTDIVVMVQMAKAVAYYDRQGQLKWSAPSGGRFVSTSGSLVFANDLVDLKLVVVRNLAGDLVDTLTFERDVNFLAISEGRMLVGYVDNGVPVDVYEWSEQAGRGRLLFQTVGVSCSRGAALDGDVIAVADTCGNRVVFQSLSSGEVLREEAVVYPNDVVWRSGFAYVVEEHLDRVIAINAENGHRFVVVAPPLMQRWLVDVPNALQDLHFCGAAVSAPRSAASDLCSGMFTLYAPNGISLLEDGMYVADTDNSRVIFLRGGKVESALVGLNGPVKVRAIEG